MGATLTLAEVAALLGMSGATAPRRALRKLRSVERISGKRVVTAIGEKKQRRYVVHAATLERVLPSLHGQDASTFDVERELRALGRRVAELERALDERAATTRARPH